MQTYIAQTLLYNKDLISRPDPETGVIHLVEAGFVHPGQEITLGDERAEPLLAIGAIAPAPPPKPEPETPATETPKRSRR